MKLIKVREIRGPRNEFDKSPRNEFLQKLSCDFAISHGFRKIQLTVSPLHLAIIFAFCNRLVFNLVFELAFLANVI